jgi:hypothetical protein
MLREIPESAFQTVSLSLTLYPEGAVTKDKTRLIFYHSKRSLFHRARERALDEPVDSAQQLIESLKLHFAVYKQNIDSNGFQVAQSENYIRNTTFSLFQICAKNLPLDKTIQYLNSVLSVTNGYLDPLEDPIREEFSRFRLQGYEAAVPHRAKREIAKLLDLRCKNEVWLDKGCFDRLRSVILALDRAISSMLKR